MMRQTILFSEDKKHNTELIIDTSQLIDNLLTIKRILKTETKLMLVVKAWAYGVGSKELIALLEDERLIDYLSVANVDEGVELRKEGIKLPILVLNPTVDSFKVMVKYQLEAAIYSIELLQELFNFLSSIDRDPNYKFPIHLKFNTGMNRLGFDWENLGSIHSILEDQRVVEVKSLMTHLSSASKEDEDEFTLAQLSLFESFKENLKEIVPHNAMTHALNSAGTLRFPNFQMSMVRIGIAAYGGIQLNDSKFNIKPAVVFKSKVLQFRRVKSGGSISYSRSGILKCDSNIACLSIGYGDGFSRRLGNGMWEIEINGKLYPTIGNICMDITIVNLGNDEVSIGDDAIVFGGIKSLFEYAHAQETIPYESLTAISRRVKRTYIKN